MTPGVGRSIYCCLFVLLLLLFEANAAAAAQQCTEAPFSNGNVSVSGAVILRDGLPWAAKGVNSWGLMAPKSKSTNLRFPSFQWPVGNFKPDVLDDMVRFGADSVRFLIGQHYLDPENPHYTPAYIDEITRTVRAARERGLVVVLAMNRSPEVDITARTIPHFASASTGRAWQSLLKHIGCDHGVIIDIFNEPVNTVREPIPTAWHAWRTLHQRVIDQLRQAGAVNPIMVEAMRDGVFASSVAINQPGTGYKRGNGVCMTGGYPTRVACGTVRTVDENGGAQEVILTDAGVYAGGNQPSSPVHMTGGSGTGLKLTVTWALASDCTDCLQELSLDGVSTYGIIEDPLDQVIYSLHLYPHKSIAKLENWERHWLYLNGIRPVLIGEWGLDAYVGCDTDLQTYVVKFLNTVKETRLGIFAWTWSTPNHLFVNPARSSALTTYANGITCGTGSAGPGKTIHRFFKTGDVALE
ncbi:MAG: cellulase family glycosylhydrolase [Alphaproteobacteria bacterium]